MTPCACHISSLMRVFLFFLFFFLFLFLFFYFFVLSLTNKKGKTSEAIRIRNRLLNEMRVNVKQLAKERQIKAKVYRQRTSLKLKMIDDHDENSHSNNIENDNNNNSNNSNNNNNHNNNSNNNPSKIKVDLPVTKMQRVDTDTDHSVGSGSNSPGGNNIDKVAGMSNLELTSIGTLSKDKKEIETTAGKSDDEDDDDDDDDDNERNEFIDKLDTFGGSVVASDDFDIYDYLDERLVSRLSDMYSTTLNLFVDPILTNTRATIAKSRLVKELNYEAINVIITDVMNKGAIADNPADYLLETEYLSRTDKLYQCWIDYVSSKHSDFDTTIDRYMHNCIELHHNPCLKIFYDIRNVTLIDIWYSLLANIVAFFGLCIRSLRYYFRKFWFVAINILISLVAAFVLFAIFGEFEERQKDIQNRFGVLSFSCIFIGIQAIASASVFHESKDVFIDERNSVRLHNKLSSHCDEKCFLLSCCFVVLFFCFVFMIRVCMDRYHICWVVHYLIYF